MKLFTAADVSDCNKLMNHRDTVLIKYARRFDTKLAYTRMFQVTQQFFVTDSSMVFSVVVLLLKYNLCLRNI